MTAARVPQPVDAMPSIVERHLDAAVAELLQLGMTDDDARVHFLEVLAQPATWLADPDDARWRVAKDLLTHDQPPFNDEPVSNEVRPLIVNLTDALLWLIETRGNTADDDYSRAKAEEVDADFAVLARIVAAATAWHLLPMPLEGVRS